MKPSIYFLIAMALILSACGPTAEQQATRTSAAATQTASSWTATPTITLTATITPTPTPTPTLTPTATPTFTSTPTATATSTVDPNLFVSPDGVFSMVPPKDWAQKTDSNGYPTFEGPKSGSVAARLNFLVDYGDDMPFKIPNFFSASFQDALTPRLVNLTKSKEDFLQTPAGVSYLRWEIEHTISGQDVHQVIYFFDDQFPVVMITFSRLKSQGTQLDAVVDAAVQTVKILK